jgi:type I restriction enzyme, S subunit
MIFYKETEFKEDSKIGKIPKDWGVVKLADVCELIRGTEPGSKSYNTEGIGIRFIRVSDISKQVLEGVFINEANNLVICKKDDILLALDGVPGVVAKGFEGAISSGIRIVKPKTDKIDKEFLFYVLQHKIVQKVIENYTTGTTIKHASRAVDFIILPLPPIEEQKAIAQILLTFDKAIQKTDEIIAKTELLKKGLMKELLTGRIRVEEKDGKIVFRKETEFKEDTEIGKIPKDWKVVKLGDIANIQRGASPRPKGDPKYFGGDIPWIKISDLSKYKKGIYLPATEDTVTEEGRKRSVYVKDGSLIISNSGTIGEPAIVKTGRGGCIHDGLVLLTPLIKVEKLFLYYFFEHKKGEFQIRAQKGTQGNMNTTLWKMVKLPLPPLEEQQKIAEILLTIDKKLELERKRKEKLERIKKGLMDLLLTGKIRIKNLED